MARRKQTDDLSDIMPRAGQRPELHNLDGRHGHQCQHVNYGACDRCKYPLRPRLMPPSPGGKAIAEDARRKELGRILAEIKQQIPTVRSLLHTLAEA